MYFTDMPNAAIEAFDYDARTGTLGARRLLVDLAGQPGLADGSTVDREGGLWNAQWAGGKLVRYLPDGTVDREVPLPVSNPTCITFGGPNYETLYITTAWFGLSPDIRSRQPHAGGIFSVTPGMRGWPERRFGG